MQAAGEWRGGCGGRARAVAITERGEYLIARQRPTEGGLLPDYSPDGGDFLTDHPPDSGGLPTDHHGQDYSQEILPNVIADS